MLHQHIADTGPIHYQEATALAALIRTKQLSSREVVQAHLDRIEAVESRDQRRRHPYGRAGARERRRRGRSGAVASGAPLGRCTACPLDQVPGHRGCPHPSAARSCSSEIFRTRMRPRWRITKAAGGIPLMKSNLPEFSAWTESDNLVTGRTNNPWNLERTPGGSSGGEIGGAGGRHVADRHRQRCHDLPCVARPLSPVLRR